MATAEVTDGNYYVFAKSPNRVRGRQGPFLAVHEHAMACSKLHEMLEGLRPSPTVGMLRMEIGERVRAQAEAS